MRLRVPICRALDDFRIRRTRSEPPNARRNASTAASGFFLACELFASNTKRNVKTSGSMRYVAFDAGGGNAAASTTHGTPCTVRPRVFERERAAKSDSAHTWSYSAKTSFQ